MLNKISKNLNMYFGNFQYTDKNSYIQHLPCYKAKQMLVKSRLHLVTILNDLFTQNEL